MNAYRNSYIIVFWYILIIYTVHRSVRV